MRLMMRLVILLVSGILISTRCRGHGAFLFVTGVDHALIMVGMLIPVFGLHNIAIRHGILSKVQIFFQILLGVGTGAAIIAAAAAVSPATVATAAPTAKAAAASAAWMNSITVPFRTGRTSHRHDFHLCAFA